MPVKHAGPSAPTRSASHPIQDNSTLTPKALRQRAVDDLRTVTAMRGSAKYGSHTNLVIETGEAGVIGVSGTIDGIQIEQVVNGVFTGTTYVRVVDWSEVVGAEKGPGLNRALRGRWIYGTAYDKKLSFAAPVAAHWQNPFGGTDGKAPTALGSRTIGGLETVGFTDDHGTKVWVRRTGPALPVLAEVDGWTYAYSPADKPSTVTVPDQEDTISWTEVRAGRFG